MINGKFFTGLPANMVDRSKGLNRQQTNFFWPDDSQNQSAVESRVKRRSSIQAENRNAYIHRPDQSNFDAENKERFKKEFTKSSIQFNDNVEQTPPWINMQKITSLPQQKPQNVQPHVSTRGKPDSYTSKIEFYDFAEDLNNVPRTDKNNKVEVERNTKNSPKLQNKHLSFDPPDEAINFIENDVKNMRITAPPRRRNTVRDNRPKYGRALANEGQNYSDYNEDYHSPRRLPLPPVRSRYPESDPDFEQYSSRRLGTNPRTTYNDIDGPLGRPRRQDLCDDETVSTRKIGRQVHFSYSAGNEQNSIAVDRSQDYHDMGPPPQQMTRKINILKVENDFKNNEHRTAPHEPSSPPPTSPPPTVGASHKHLMSNICFSDTESATNTSTPPCPPRKNIRSRAVNKVSVGLPD